LGKELIKQFLARKKPTGLLLKVLLLGAVFAILFLSAKGFNTGYKITDQPATKIPPPIPKVTLESIFTKPNVLGAFDQSKLITLIATGDVIPARGANWPASKSGDFTYNWKKTADFLKRGDLTLINLEAPLMKGCQLKSEGFTFCGDARHINGIVFAGVDSVSLANNHIGNFGQPGLNETINLLETNKIGWSGFGHLDIHQVKGIKFGFLAYNGVGAAFNQEVITSEIKESKGKVDVLVVSAHWGAEYELVPKAAPGVAPDDPREIAHLIIDSGADLVIGNHPHTVQGVEIYKGKLITYAHGNFIFDQTWSQETQEGVVGEYTFYAFPETLAKEDTSELKGQTLEAKLVNVRFYPILVDSSYQPRFLPEKEGAHILNRMLESSNLIKTSP
jgi:poly-gamma-glutamate synthesis protein (capsule biosynthesis protein)